MLYNIALIPCILAEVKSRRLGGLLLPAYPSLRIELGCFLSKLEVQYAFAFIVGGYGTDEVACMYLLAAADDDR